ncbi:MAG TPA: hypothetical protein VK081_02695 [Planctomycetota bacterium]|nr:hypothetical protein [Planctomycetota bacterium]
MVLVVWLACSALPLPWLAARAGPGRIGDALASPAVQAALSAGLLTAALAAAFALLLAWPAAVALATARFLGRGPVVRVLWWGWLCPAVLIAAGAGWPVLPADLPEAVRVACAQLVFTVPLATFVLCVSDRVPRALREEARQDGLGLLGEARHVFAPAWGRASMLAFAAAFGASLAEPAVALAMRGGDPVAGVLRAAGPDLAARAPVALAALLPALGCALALGVLLAVQREGRAEGSGSS